MTSILRCALLTLIGCAALSAGAQPTPPPQPGDEQPWGDIHRQARPAPALRTAPVGPLPQPTPGLPIERRMGSVSSDTGVAPKPGSPQPTVAPLVRPTQPLLAPTTGAPRPVLNKRARATGDEDELEDLDIQRRKAKGLPESPLTGGAPRNDRPGDETPRDTSAARR